VLWFVRIQLRINGGCKTTLDVVDIPGKYKSVYVKNICIRDNQTILSNSYYPILEMGCYSALKFLRVRLLIQGLIFQNSLAYRKAMLNLRTNSRDIN